MLCSFEVWLNGLFLFFCIKVNDLLHRTSLNFHSKRGIMIIVQIGFRLCLMKHWFASLFLFQSHCKNGPFKHMVNTTDITCLAAYSQVCLGWPFLSFSYKVAISFLTLKRQEKMQLKNDVCWSRLLQIIDNITDLFEYWSKRSGPRSDCSYGSSLIWVHIVCHRGFLNISADENNWRLLLRLAL